MQDGATILAVAFARCAATVRRMRRVATIIALLGSRTGKHLRYSLHRQSAQTFGRNIES